ncbi:MAG: helix-turn-helix domain containing protein [Polyangiaceae bacterium]|nr:helix-turn-helix domain containing protein [Polyangiaceae bacterium]
MSDAKADDDRLNLLLADADSLRPVLEEGLPSETTQEGAKPTRITGSEDSFDLRMEGESPNDLKRQRWGIIAPEGTAGDKLIEAIQPLIKLREAEQGSAPDIHRVPPELTARQALDWCEDVYWSEKVTEEDRPLYLLMLGDLHEMPAELQHALANNALVGRIHFADEAGEADLDGYEAYAKKVAKYAREGTSFTTPDMAFFVAQDGSAATRTGEAKLVRPAMDASRRLRAKGSLAISEVRDIAAETAEELLAAGSGERPSVLLSVSHGMGPPRRGWKTPEEQRRKQGSLIVDSREVLGADELAGETFLPGGMWFCLACFGGGTPMVSAYHTWLAHLAEEGAWSGQAEAVLKNLPQPGQRPFIAAMPQAALRNPNGPLGVIGHLDLAWTYGFSSMKNPSESKKLRIFKALQSLAKGDRAGVGLNALLQFYREANDALMASYSVEEEARVNKRNDPTDRIDRGHLWMLRNDLRGYVLLGDPAARLPLQKLTLAPETAPREELVDNSTELAIGGAPGIIEGVKGGNSAIPTAEKEAAVLAMLQGDEAPRAIAERAGISLEELWRWVDVFRAGGRDRLSE